MGHYRRLYEETLAALRQGEDDLRVARAEAARWRVEADKTIAFAKRERERGDNLQREVQGLEGEVARRDATMAEYESKITTPRSERDTDRDEMALGMLRAIEGRRCASENATDTMRRIIRECDDWQAEAARLRFRVSTLEELNSSTATKRETLAHCTVVNEEYKRQQAEVDRDDWRSRYDAAMARVDELEAQVKAPTVVPHRRWKMPDERLSRTVKLRIGDKGLIKKCPTCKQPTPDSPRCSAFTLHIGYKPDGTIGEWFIRPDREKKTDLVASLADGWATSSSYAIQNGGDVDWLTEKARYARDESAGVPLVWDEDSGDPNKYIPHPALGHVSSVLDYAAKIVDRVKAGKPAVRLTEEEAAELAKKLAEAEVTP